MLLFYVYIAAFVAGGILLGASLLLGAHDEADAHLEADVQADTDAEAHAEAGSHGELWLPFLSVRFWVFFLCFFGLTGTAFSLLGLAGKWVTLAAAIITGGGVGFAAAFIIQRLKRQEVGVAPGEEDLKGLDGVALWPLPPGGKGKVRLEVHGQIVDLVARSESKTDIRRGGRVTVIDVQQNELLVVAAGELEAAAEKGA